MAQKRFGKLPPRHDFILNPYDDLRLSKCPKCDRPTHMRKFALLIVIDEFGTMVLGKTCRFCTPCDLLMVHQDELEHELVLALEPRAPDVIGNEYMVFGTVDKKLWRKRLKSGGGEIGDILNHAADFKKELNLEYDPGGWRPGTEKR
jgi:hypothetical protein